MTIQTFYVDAFVRLFIIKIIFPVRQARAKPARIDYILMKLNGGLGEISISLWQKMERFASLGIAGGACVLTMKKPYTMFEMTLNGVYMNNHVPSTLHPKVNTNGLINPN